MTDVKQIQLLRETVKRLQREKSELNRAFVVKCGQVDLLQSELNLFHIIDQEKDGSKSSLIEDLKYRVRQFTSTYLFNSVIKHTKPSIDKNGADIQIIDTDFLERLNMLVFPE